MPVVKIKNINKSFMKKPFVVKGRIKYVHIETNRNSCGSHLNAILFDSSSEIEVVAFKNCEQISNLLKKNNVVSIENGVLREVNKDYKKTKHKYQIILESISLITIINNDEVNIVDFPLHKYTSGAELKTLTTGMIIDVIGVCIQLDSENTVNVRNQIIRRGKISVDSTQIDVKFSDDKVDELYEVGSTLLLTGVKYISYRGYLHLSVGNSSSVIIHNPQLQLSNGIVMEQLQLEKDSTIELPDPRPSTSSINQSYRVSDLVDESIDQKPSTSGSTPSNKNSVDESIDQRPSTSGSTPSNKRKTLQEEEIGSKMLKTAEPEESFSDERFVDMVMHLMQTLNSNNYVIKLRILEFISKVIKENEK